MQIAICDDMQKELKTIRAALDTYAKVYPELHFDLDEYVAAIDVLNTVEKGKHMITLFWTFVCREFSEQMWRRKCFPNARI